MQYWDAVYAVFRGNGVQMKRRMTTSRDGTSCVVVGSGCLNATQARTESWWEIVWWHRFSGGRPVSPSLHSRREPTLPALQRCPPAPAQMVKLVKEACPVSEFHKKAKGKNHLQGKNYDVVSARFFSSWSRGAPSRTLSDVPVAARQWADLRGSICSGCTALVWVWCDSTSKKRERT